VRDLAGGITGGPHVQDNQHYPAAPATPPATARTTALICTIAGSITTTIMIVADFFYWVGASEAQLGYQEHGAIIGLCAVLFIVGGIAWLIDAVARWLDNREDARAAAIVDDLSGRLMANEARLKTIEEQLPQVLRLLQPRAEEVGLRGYEREFVDRLHENGNGNGRVHRLPSSS
jgi:uncharacterized membrane protein YphA (DoxX/SURF4 family)